LPNLGPRPQTSHTLAMLISLLRVEAPVYQLQPGTRNRADDRVCDINVEPFEGVTEPRPEGSDTTSAANSAFVVALRVCDINVEPFEGVAEPRPEGSDTTSAASSAF
jgi:hypothetical protein